MKLNGIPAKIVRCSECGTKMIVYKNSQLVECYKCGSVFDTMPQKGPMVEGVGVSQKPKWFDK